MDCAAAASNGAAADLLGGALQFVELRRPVGLGLAPLQCPDRRVQPPLIGRPRLWEGRVAPLQRATGRSQVK